MKLRSSLVAVVAALAGTLAIAGSASAAPTWAPAATAPVHPGVQTLTDGAQCTANFIYFDASNVYIGQAAHCSGTGGNTETNGCDSATLPVGTKVDVDGASQPGTMVYNSWATMQAQGETDPDTCQYNDLALVRLDPADHARVNPSVPVWGGPTGVSPGPGTLGSVYSYGNSSLRLGLTLLSPKRGLNVTDAGGGWSHNVYTVTPGIPGDSGSGFLDAQGRATGVLSTVALLPLPLSNGVGDMSRELNYARAHWNGGLQLVNGTESFKPNALPLG